MFHDILIVFDNQEICPEALAYGREFALRMKARVTFLMLMNIPGAGRMIADARRASLQAMQERTAALLRQSAEAFVEQGIEVGSAFQAGEPAHELLKFIAEHAPFMAIIWGSGSDLPGKGHWIGRVSGKIECPLLTVSRKGTGRP